jgi:hypothetical protein
MIPFVHHSQLAGANGSFNRLHARMKPIALSDSAVHDDRPCNPSAAGHQVSILYGDSRVPHVAVMIVTIGRTCLYLLKSPTVRSAHEINVSGNRSRPSRRAIVAKYASKLSFPESRRAAGKSRPSVADVPGTVARKYPMIGVST